MITVWQCSHCLDLTRVLYSCCALRSRPHKFMLLQLTQFCSEICLFIVVCFSLSRDNLLLQCFGYSDVYIPVSWCCSVSVELCLFLMYSVLKMQLLSLLYYYFVGLATPPYRC